MNRATYMLLIGLFGAALAGCPYASGQHEKLVTETTPKDPEATALPPEPPAAPKPAPVVAEVEPADAGAPIASDADAGAPIAKAPAKPAAKPTPAAAPTDAPTCGTKDNPCPMQKFMRVQMATATTADALAAGFAKTATLSPEAGWSWKAMAEKGASSAKSGDVPAAKAQCKACHDAYKEKYKAQYRARPVKS